jgi:predicted amidohydrolase
MVKVAAIQMASGPNVSANLNEANRLIAKAADAGAHMVVLPENFAIMGMSEHDKVDVREQDGQGQIQYFLSKQAARHGVWIVGGTIPLVAEDDNKVRGTCLLLDDKGNRVARYDKIHLFDVHVPESGEYYNESETLESGNEAVVADTPFGRVGLAVCYDLRFPELFRKLVDQGAQIIVMPSAFTAITGNAHWEVLVRARAIENLCYMVASAQGGYHVNGRETYGNSMIVNPWGVVMDRLSHGAGFVIADLDMDYLNSTRRNFPVLEHRKMRCADL